MSQVSVPKSNENYNKADIHTLSNFQWDASKVRELPQIPATNRTQAFSKNQPVSQPDTQLTFNATILKALQRNPEIAQNISELAAQNAYIDIAKAGLLSTTFRGGFPWATWAPVSVEVKWLA